MKEHRIRRLFAEDKRIVIVAFDHAAFMGPINGLENPGQLIDDIVEVAVAV